MPSWAGSHRPEVRAWFRDGGAECVRYVFAPTATCGRAVSVDGTQDSGGTTQESVFLIKPGGKVWARLSSVMMEAWW